MSDFLIDFSSLEPGERPTKLTHKKLKSVKNISSAKTAGGEVSSSKDIIQSLYLRFINHKYLLNNAFIFSDKWETDFFSVSEAGYLYEIEIKVTKSDFKDDFDKTEKHQLLESSVPEKWYMMPNKFFYAVPKGMLPTHLIPPYAGLIEVSGRNTPAEVIKEAPFLHKEKQLDKYMKTLLDKFSWRYWDLYNKTQDIDFED